MGYFHLLIYPFWFLDLKMSIALITKKSYFRKKIGELGDPPPHGLCLLRKKPKHKCQKPKGPTFPRMAWGVVRVCSKEKGMKKQKMEFCPNKQNW